MMHNIKEEDETPVREILQTIRQERELLRQGALIQEEDETPVQQIRTAKGVIIFALEAMVLSLFLGFMLWVVAR